MAKRLTISLKQKHAMEVNHTSTGREAMKL